MFDQLKVAGVMTQNYFAILTVDVNALLNEKGADEQGGALEQVGNLVKEYGAGAVNISRNIFVYIAVFGLLVTAICMVIHGNNVGKRSEERSGLFWKVAGIVLGFAAVSIVILLQTIGTSLFS